jgi:hypothetical protein
LLQLLQQQQPAWASSCPALAQQQLQLCASWLLEHVPASRLRWHGVQSHLLLLLLLPLLKLNPVVALQLPQRPPALMVCQPQQPEL